MNFFCEFLKHFLSSSSSFVVWFSYFLAKGSLKKVRQLDIPTEEKIRGSTLEDEDWALGSTLEDEDWILVSTLEDEVSTLEDEDWALVSTLEATGGWLGLVKEGLHFTS